MRPHANFASDAVLSAVTAAAGRGLALLGLMATTRIFTADSYGAWLLVLTFSGFFLPLATLRLEVPLVMARSRRMMTGLMYVIAFCLLMVLISVLAFSAFATPTQIERLTGLANNQSGLILFSVPTVLVLACQLLNQSKLMQMKKFRALAMVNMVSPLISLLLTLLLPQFLPATPQLAAIIFLASICLGLTIAIPAQIGPPSRASSFSKWAMARAALRQYNVYPKYTLPLSLSASVTERVTQLVLAQAYSLGTLASFYMARQILSGITSVIAGSLRNVFFAHSSWDNSISETRNRALGMLKLLTYLLAPALAFAVFRIEDAVRFLAGDKWPSLAPMAWLCMFPATVLIFTGPLDRVFDLVGRQRLSVLLQVASDVVTLVSIAIAVHFSVPSQTLVAIISLVLTVYNAIWLCFTLQSLSVSATEVGRVFVRFSVCFAVCLFLQWPLMYLGSKLLSWMISLAFLGFLVTPGMVALLNSLPFLRNRISPDLSGLLARLP